MVECCVQGMYQFAVIDQEKTQNLLKSSNVFIEESLEFIRSIVKDGKLSQERGKRYIKEILHSIFFICYINRPAIHPNDFLRIDLYSTLHTKFEDVFQSYTSQLPRRPPFSILLEVVVETSRDRSETAVIEQLRELNDDMIIRRNEGRFCGNDFCFGATVMSYSYFQGSGQPTPKYFGASMSCKGRTATRIFICVACIETWNDNVAHAVCLADRHHRSIMWPKGVWSAAYHLCLVQEGERHSHIYKPMPPCSLCKKIFPNVKFSPLTEEHQGRASWNYGNCAECEAISNLLNGETSVSKKTEQLKDGLVPSLMTLRVHREHQLRGHLNECNVEVNPEARFYNPE